MEIYKRQVGYEDLSFYRVIDNNLPISASSYLITANTKSKLFFPFMLTQDVTDIGIYTDIENPIDNITEAYGLWNLTNSGINSICLPNSPCTVTFTTVQPSFYGASNGSITATIGGTNCPFPTSIIWTKPDGTTVTNQNTISNLSEGTYLVKVTDSNCNFKQSSLFLAGPGVLSATIQANSSQTNILTFGASGCTGSAQVYPTGGVPPYTYTWYLSLPPYTSSTVYAAASSTLTGLTGLCAGIYTVQVTDSDNTLVSQQFTITEPSPLSGTVKTGLTINISCNGGSNGSITAQAAGGYPVNGYTYKLSNNISGVPVLTTINSTGSATFNNLAVGTYYILINDIAGNNVTLPPVTITQPQVVTFSISSIIHPYDSTYGYYKIGYYGVTTNVGQTSSNGVTITANGGTPQYQISLTNLQSNTPGSTTNTNAGTYSVAVRDRNNCSATNQTIKLLQYPYFKVLAGGCTYDPIGAQGSVSVSIVWGYDSPSVLNPYTTIPISNLTYDYYVDGNLVASNQPYSYIITSSYLTIGVNHTINARVNGVSGPEIWPVGQFTYSASLAGAATTNCT